MNILVSHDTYDFNWFKEHFAKSTNLSYNGVTLYLVEVTEEELTFMELSNTPYIHFEIGAGGTVKLGCNKEQLEHFLGENEW